MEQPQCHSVCTHYTHADMLPRQPWCIPSLPTRGKSSRQSRLLPCLRRLQLTVKALTVKVPLMLMTVPLVKALTVKTLPAKALLVTVPLVMALTATELPMS